MRCCQCGAWRDGFETSAEVSFCPECRSVEGGTMEDDEYWQDRVLVWSREIGKLAQRLEGEDRTELMDISVEMKDAAEQ